MKSLAKQLDIWSRLMPEELTMPNPRISLGWLIRRNHEHGFTIYLKIMPYKPVPLRRVSRERLLLRFIGRNVSRRKQHCGENRQSRTDEKSRTRLKTTGTSAEHENVSDLTLIKMPPHRNFKRQANRSLKSPSLLEYAAK